LNKIDIMLLSAININLGDNLDLLKENADFTYLKTYNSIRPDAWLAWNNSGHVAVRPMEIIGKDGKFYLVLFYLANYRLDCNDGERGSEQKKNT
jgi:hypothetical protein